MNVEHDSEDGRRTSARRLPTIATPTRLITLSFAGAIASGTLLLRLPVSHGDQDVGVLDALFTATSAVCVTGLAVLDTGTAYSGFGQFVILLLFQLGGLGLLTFGTLLALATGRRLGVGDRLRLNEQVSGSNVGGIVGLVRSIAIVVALAEVTGALLLYSRFASTEGVGAGAWHAVFHSVSAFNNAGFSLNSDSLMAYVDDPIVNFTVMALITVGGLGFVVITNLYQWSRRTRPRVRLTLHTRMVLSITGFLTAAGVSLILIAEWNNDGTLGPLTAPGRVLAALFQAVTPRTAGFNTLDYGQLTTAGLLVTMLLMFIGGNPGSTAGGIKTITFYVVVLSIWSTIRGRADTAVFRRRIAQETVVRAAAIAGGAAILGGAAVTMLAVFEPDVALQSLLFETISALGTVGLSVGITSELGDPARLVLIMLMFVGRIGLLTFALALVSRERTTALRHPAEDVVVG
jgi:trk system potassium uptake protein TrkH